MVVGTSVMNLVEPMQGIGVGVLGPWAWKRSVRKGRKICVVNGGVSGSRSGDWLSGSSYYNDIVARAQIALAQPGAYLAGFISFNGLNDAKDVSAGPTWTSNTLAMFNSLKSVLGNAPIYLVRYPATVPPDPPMPSHAEVRAAIAAASFAAGIVDAPEGPWVDAQVHLATAANIAAATSLDALIP